MARRLKDLARRNPPIYTRSKIAENLKECRESMLYDSMFLSTLMVRVQQVEEDRKRKHTKAGKKSSQDAKNFSRKSSTEFTNKPRFKKGLSHQ